MNSAMHLQSNQIPFPLYAVLISHRGKLIQEDYYPPFTEDRMHRMFSITKSFTALAVCALAAEGKLSLNDPIISYFPDYTPSEPHPYLASMTIQDLLDMRTCHKSTTYKIDLSENWVRSFFITPPDHRSGQIFKYDTSAAHTLAALVKRVSGNGILDYLRPIYLNAAGFSKEAHVLKDPFGDEIGGSGLIARPKDILCTAQFLMSLYLNTWQKQYPQVLSETYDTAFFERYRKWIMQCMSWRSATMHEGKTLDECQGYGSQFWMIRNGFAMYGMGGQYAVFYPEEELIIVTAADSQSVQGGNQYILDEMNRIDNEVRASEHRSPSPVTFPDRPDTHGDEAAMNAVVSRLAGHYRFLENSQGFTACTISMDAVVLERGSDTFRFPVSLQEPSEITDALYHQKLYVSTSPMKDGSLYQYVQILDEYVGSIRVLIQGDGTHLTVYLRKIEESLFAEMNGFFEAVKEA